MSHTVPAEPTEVPPGCESFAAVLRERTKLVHREAERSGFLAELIRGRATREGYALFLRNLVPVYAALESALDAHRDGPFAAFADPRLRRLPALVGDLEAIAGSNWASALTPLPAATIYANAIAEASAEAPRLLAHAYARYLGDLSGGQILKPILARTLGLAPDMLGFYDFPRLADVDAAKRAMRDALDTVPAGDPAADTIVIEAVAAFSHNIAVSEAVAAASRAP